MLATSPETRLVEVLPHQLDTFETGCQDQRQCVEEAEAQLEDYLSEASLLQTMKVDASQHWSQSFKTKLRELPGNKDGDIDTRHHLFDTDTSLR